MTSLTYKGLLSALLGDNRDAGDAFADDVAFGASIGTESAINRYKNSNFSEGYKPGAYDTRSGAMAGAYTAKLFGPGSLTNPIAQQTLRGLSVRNKGELSTMDMVIAASTYNSAMQDMIGLGYGVPGTIRSISVPMVSRSAPATNIIR